MKNIEFTRALVKGKIAETIFFRLFSTHGYKVIDFGYEKTTPELIGNYKDEDDATLKQIKTKPDFVLIGLGNMVRLVEVKYQREFDKHYLLKDVDRMKNSWNTAWLFLATQKKFYFNDIETILRNNGEMTELPDTLIAKKIQDEHRQILIDFERNN